MVAIAFHPRLTTASCLTALLWFSAPAAAEEVAAAEETAAAQVVATAQEPAAPRAPATTDHTVARVPSPSAEVPVATDADPTTSASTGSPESGASAAAASAPAIPVTGAQRLEEALGDSVDPLDQIERQIDAQEYREPMAWLEQRVGEVAAESHQFDPRLVRPLILLGDAHAGQGQYQEALDQYQRALHLSRVNQGLNSPQQVEIVYREAEALKALGQFQEANDREEYAYHVLNRAHGTYDEELLPGIYHLAHWYERTSNVYAARALYERAQGILEHHGQLDTPAAVPALQGIATSYRMERFPPFYAQDLEMTPGSVVADNGDPQRITVNNFPAGEEALQRIVRIRQSQEPVDPAAVAGAVLDLADWYTLFDKSSRAGPLYRHAWELLASAEAVDVVAFFSEPHLLYFPAPGNPAAPPIDRRGERETGYVEVAFDVTDDGYVRGLDTVASQPEGMMDFRVRKSLRVARYRPVLVDGVPVARDDFTYRHEFPYYPELDSGEAAPAATTTAAATSSGS